MRTSRFYYTTPLIFFKGGVLPFGALSIPEQKVTYSERHTIAALYDDETKTIKFGLATCSTKDRFQKSIGRDLALARAEFNPFYVITDIDENCSKQEFTAKIMEVFQRTEAQLLVNKYGKYFDSDRIITQE